MKEEEKKQVIEVSTDDNDDIIIPDPADIDGYFFEEEGVQMKKIDGIRMSLCMSIKILA